MPRSAFFSLLFLSIVGLSACSKKQEPNPSSTPPADQPPAPAAPAQTTAAAAAPDAEAPKEFDFSGKSFNTGPSSPPQSVQAGQPEAAPTETITVQMPVRVEYYPPFYPLSDRMKGTEGRLVVGLVVTETGAVESPSILSSTMPAYADEVIKAAAQWRFIPALHEGKPLRFPVQIPVTFISEFGSGDMPSDSPLADLALVDGTYYTVGSDGKYTPANIDVTPLTRVEPVFRVSSEAKELRVVLRFKVNEEGRVIDPVIDESSNTEFDDAALKAIRFWQFVPKIRNGKPVTAPAKLPLRISK